MTSYYVKKFQGRYGETADPVINRYAAKWGWEALLSDYNMVVAKELVDYYFTTASTNRHKLDWFFYNYEKLIKAMAEGKEDRAHRQKLMEESKARAERWRQSGKQGITNN